MTSIMFGTFLKYCWRTSLRFTYFNCLGGRPRVFQMISSICGAGPYALQVISFVSGADPCVLQVNTIIFGADPYVSDMRFTNCGAEPYVFVKIYAFPLHVYLWPF